MDFVGERVGSGVLVDMDWEGMDMKQVGGVASSVVFAGRRSSLNLDWYCCWSCTL